MKLKSDNPKGQTGANRTLTLWLVDDHAQYRQLLAEQFNRDPNIRCAKQFDSAEAVLAALQTSAAPDVILSDIQMGRMGGVEAVAPIKRLAPATHVVMLTTFFNPSAERTAQRAGAAGFLLKRYDFSQILEFVQNVAAGRGNGKVTVGVGRQYANDPPSLPTQSFSRPSSFKPSFLFGLNNDH